jgi:hypothetical protein
LRPFAVVSLMVAPVESTSPNCEWRTGSAASFLSAGACRRFSSIFTGDRSRKKRDSRRQRQSTQRQRAAAQHAAGRPDLYVTTKVKFITTSFKLPDELDVTGCSDI